MTNTIDDLGRADVMLLVGSNATDAHPVIGAMLRANARAGTQRLVVIDPRRTSLARSAVLHLRPRPGSDVALLNAIMNVVLDEGLADDAFIAERTEGFEALAAHVREWTPERAEEFTGVPADDIRAAARIFAEAERGAIGYCMGVTQHVGGTDTVLAIADLAMLTGNIGREGTGVYPLRGQNNVQGACDMGALPDLLPGYKRADDPDARAAFEQAWDVELPTTPGLSVVEMTQAAHDGRVKALYVMGENPVLSDPDQAHVVEALRALDFLVVQDIFLTETARLADVVLPAAAFAEKDGTFTNTERRVQLVRRAVAPPGEARTDLDIVWGLCRRIGVTALSSAKGVMAEIAAVVPQYAGVTYERLEAGGLQWPVYDADHPGTPILHAHAFTRGLGMFVVVEPQARPADGMILLTGRLREQYHTGSMTRRSVIGELQPTAFVEINPIDAARLDIAEGDVVEIDNERGSIQVEARVNDASPVGAVFVPMHFAEAAVNALTDASRLDPQSRMPALKATPVRVRKIVLKR